MDKTLYIAGCIGFDPKTMEIVGGGVEAETSQALTNMGAVLKAAGCTHNNVVKTTVLLNDIKDSAAVNEVYKKFFPTHYPARTGFQVPKYSHFFCWPFKMTKTPQLSLKYETFPKK